MLAYGFIFHMGFFNFYLAIGLCFWYLAIVWERGWQIHMIAAPVLLLAWFAHPLPVVWSLSAAAYVALLNRIPTARRHLPLLLGLLTLAASRYILTHRYPYTRSLNQAAFITGANQIALFNMKYALPLTALLLVWAVLLHHLVKRHSMAVLFSTIPFQLWLLTAAAVMLIPERLFFPQFSGPLGFIAERLSLAAGLLICAVLAAAPTTRPIKVALVLVALLFFAFLYTDQRELNRMEDKLDAVVNALPQGQRVVTSLQDRSLRSLCLHHNLDRACIGHCFSYANYEPSSRQFRIRALPHNAFVLDDYSDIGAVADGSYQVRARDLPLTLVYACGPEFTSFCSRPLLAGESIANSGPANPSSAN
jgi:hypothetical protein